MPLAKNDDPSALDNESSPASGVPITKSIDALMAELTAKTERELARIHSKGGEPASTGDQYGCSCPVFGFSLRWRDPAEGLHGFLPDHIDIAEIRLIFQNDRGEPVMAWGEPWPGRGAAVFGVSLLEEIAENWEEIAQDFMIERRTYHEDEGELEVDLTRTLWEPHDFEIVTCGPEIILQSGNVRSRLMSESVIVAETIMTLADLIADRIRNCPEEQVKKAVAAWNRVRPLADLLPAPLDVWPEAFGDKPPGASDRIEAEAAFYARRLGMDPQVYRRAAIWLMARQYLFAAGLVPSEPSAKEWASFTDLEDLPTESVVALMIEEGAQAVGMAPEDLISSALSMRNMDARQALYYRHWPDRYDPTRAGASAG
jgi:hypothetical protein